ncbi:MAG: lytic transglycosylase domain-containing protein [Gemmatimonadota bacterium]|nr:lytic transglycosylase domain-containing protein [Gemmatimonadota bacterium]
MGSPFKRMALPAVGLLMVLVAASRPDVADDGADGLPYGEGLIPVSLAPQLPVQMNERVEKWIGRFQTVQRAEFQRILDRQGIFSGLIVDRLRRRGMPEDLVFLAMMESGLHPRAVSRASAVGVWQFMSPTALQYGLRVDEWVDERQDPVRATDAALDYLQWLHDHYRSWYLAAAAYNAGPGRVDHVLNRYADGRRGEEEIYWDVIQHLPRETREYVPRLVAAMVLGSDPESFGFEASAAAPYQYETVFVPGSTSLRRIALALGVPHDVIRDLNPHLMRDVTPPGETYAVRVPPRTASLVVASIDEIRRRRGVRNAD